MKRNAIIALVALGLCFCSLPLMAQSRVDGNRGSSASSSSRSSSSTSSRSSGVSASRSSSGSTVNRSSASTPSRSSNATATQKSSSTPARTSSTPESRKGRSSMGNAPSGTSRFGTPSTHDRKRTDVGASAHRPSRTPATKPGSSHESKTPGVTPRNGTRNAHHRTPGELHHPSAPVAPKPPLHKPMPPSARPMHPAPYFHHPYHHARIHMRPVFWNPVPPPPIHCPGFWFYCNNYWYDYHTTDVIVVREYASSNYGIDLVSYAISDNLMYAIVKDHGTTYLRVFDRNDNLLAEQPIHRKYIKMEIDRENGGCWIFKKKDKDPMLFLYAGDELMVYEAD